MSTPQSTTGAADSPVTTAATTPIGRKRPLRTYSRRSLQNREQEPESTTAVGTRRTSSSPSPSDCAEPPVQLPTLPRKDQAQRPNRGSILTYFKPLAPSSDIDATFDIPSDPVEPVSTPPSSPPALSNSRKRRRLTTRPQFCEVGQHSEDGARDDTTADNNSTEDARVLQACSPTIDESTIIVRTEACDSMRSTLGEVAVNILPQQTGTASALADRGTRNKRPREKRKAKDMTQTTLSLSVHKEPGFTICSVCDILYNPLNEKDRKEHKRRHAAHTRNMARPVWA